MKRASMFGTTAEISKVLSSTPSFKRTPLIWDIRALSCLTPFRSGFCANFESRIKVKDVRKFNKVIRIETTLHKSINFDGNVSILPCASYCMMTTVICVLSPQTYHQMHYGHSRFYGDCIKMRLTNKTIIQIPVQVGGSNLPLTHHT